MSMPEENARRGFALYTIRILISQERKSYGTDALLSTIDQIAKAALEYPKEDEDDGDDVE